MTAFPLADILCIDTTDGFLNHLLSSIIKPRGITMSTAEILKQVVKKTIAGVVIHRSVGSGPRDQLFIVFTDNTYAEFYGDVGWADRLKVGDLESVKLYTAQLGGNVIVIS